MTDGVTEPEIEAQLARLGDLRAAIGQAIVGQQAVVEQLLIGLIAFTLLTTWSKGRQLMRQNMAEGTIPIEVFAKSAHSSAARVPVGSFGAGISAYAVPAAPMASSRSAATGASILKRSDSGGSLRRVASQPNASAATKPMAMIAMREVWWCMGRRRS